MRRHNNRDGPRGLHSRFCADGKMGDDYIDIEPDEFFGKLLSTIASRVGVAELNLDVLAFRIAEAVQTAPESIRKWMRRRGRHQHANIRQFPRLLRSYRKRASKCGTANYLA